MSTRRLVASPRRASAAFEVLVVDDDKRICNTLRVCLEAAGARVDEAATATAARAAMDQHGYDLVFLDARLRQESGLSLMPALLAARPAPTVVVMTAFAGVESAVQAMRLGARDYLPKPFTSEQIRELVDRIAEERGTVSDFVHYSVRPPERRPDLDLDSCSPRMLHLLELVARAAIIDGPVLLRGDAGTGKAALARRLHALSPRGSKSFVVVNAAAAGDGVLPTADGGTLLVDDVAELSLRLQDKLLKSIDGNTRMRIICATRHRLEREVRCGRFRPELLARLQLLELVVPSVRDRAEDILPLAHKFLQFFAKSAGTPALELSPEVELALVRYRWPGNLSELIDAMERAVLLRRGNTVDIDALPDAIVQKLSQTPRVGGDFTIAELEREHILQVLGRARSQEEASRILGIDASTLWRKRRRYDGSR